MTEPQQQPSSTPDAPKPQQNNRAVILEALLAACVERGHAIFQDTSHLSIPKRTRQRVISQLRASGRLRRRGRKLYATDLKSDPKIQELDLDLLDLPPPARSKWTIRATDKELADIKERNPEGASDEVLALLGKKKSLRMSTFELDNLLRERGIHGTLTTKPSEEPADNNDKPTVPPTHTHVESTPEYFHHSPQTWLELLKCIPPEVERAVPGTEAWLKETYDEGVEAGNSPESMYLGILNEQLPRRIRERGFSTLQRCPGMTWSQVDFYKQIDAALHTDERLRALPVGHLDKGKIIVEVTLNTVGEILRGVADGRRGQLQ